METADRRLRFLQMRTSRKREQLPVECRGEIPPVANVMKENDARDQ